MRDDLHRRWPSEVERRPIVAHTVAARRDTESKPVPVEPPLPRRAPVVYRAQAQQQKTGDNGYRVGGGVTPAPSQMANFSEPQILRRLTIEGLSEQELRRRLQLEIGQTIDEAAYQRANEVVRRFDDNLRLSPVWLSIGTDTGGLWLRVYLREGAVGRVTGSVVSDIRRRLHVDIQGLSAEAESELRRRLGLRDGETFDHEGFVKELKRIHEIVMEFDSHLRDSRAVGRAARKVGDDGRVIPPDIMDVTLIISVRD